MPNISILFYIYRALIEISRYRRSCPSSLLFGFTSTVVSIVSDSIKPNTPDMTNAAHIQDGKWSWFVCLSATLSWFAAMGFVFSFGIFFPVFMDYFQESREKTGKRTFLCRFWLVTENSTMKFTHTVSVSHFEIHTVARLAFEIFWTVFFATYSDCGFISF